ncbi:hypothetical protein EC973_004641 [Apophysomyces ossiformis]|uniref:Cystathionine beta-synthase n=1 Tax=Apophysomyces ossiformis TaxID=679940 RepID=A0A8H7EMD6_9FUNG|nr:hypothetical protein EC973_004641 [Apophysomyces ossiformis]
MLYDSAPGVVISDSILDNIGYTPLVQINRITKDEGVECEICKIVIREPFHYEKQKTTQVNSASIVAKCEYFNPGGSVKDRIAKRMVEEAEAAGIITPGVSTIIEPTSGNTGIGLALMAAIKGYRLIIVLPENMSQEKVDILSALGAEIVRSPAGAAWDSENTHSAIAKRLQKEIPNAVILNQYGNPSNPMAHYDTTAEEILQACHGRLDVLVAGSGTGGTITGIAKKLKEKCPDIKIVGVDPHGSIVAEPASLNNVKCSFQVEGIGHDFVPEVLQRHLVDEWVKTGDQESFCMARRLIREEGLLCGGSSGTAMVAAIKVGKKLRKGQRVVVILPDTVRNYMSKFLRDDWMREKNFLDQKLENQGCQNNGTSNHQEVTVQMLKLKKAVSVTDTTSCKDAIELMEKNGFDQLPVANESRLKGMITSSHTLASMAFGHIQPSSPVSEIMFHFNSKGRRKFDIITVDTPLEQLAKFLTKSGSALVTSSDGSELKHIVTRLDLLSYFAKHGSS